MPRFCSMTIMLAAIPLLLSASWSHYLKPYIGQEATYRKWDLLNLSDFDLKLYIQSLFHHTDLHDILINFWKRVFNGSLTEKTVLPVSYFAAFLLAIAGIILLYRFNVRKEAGITTWDSIALGLSITVGAAGNAFMMSVLYLFFFTESEKQGLAGFSRYMGSFILGELLVVLVLLLLAFYSYAYRFSKTALDLLAAIAIVLLLNSTNLYYMTPQVFENSEYLYYKAPAQKLLDTVPEGSRIFIIYDKEQDKLYPQWYMPMQLFVQFYADGLKIDATNCGAFSSDFADPGTLEATINQFLACDYLYTMQVSDSMNQSLAQYNGDNLLEEGAIYHIEKEPFRLTKVD